MRPAGADDLLSARAIGKVYRGIDGVALEAVRDVSLTLSEGSFTTLIGPSGCGKTTLLRIIAGLDPDHTGSLAWSKPPRIGFVFQEPRLLPWRTVAQNVELMKSPSVGAGEIARLAAEFGLEEFMDRFPGELSLGLARRVALARAFAHTPNVLLLDEPFVSLDEATAATLRQLLMRVWRTNRITALMVTHNMREAIELADRLILLAPRPTCVLKEIALDIPQPERSPERIAALHASVTIEYGANSMSADNS